MKRSWIEMLSEKVGLIPNISARAEKQSTAHDELAYYPTPDQWDDFKALDPGAYPERVERSYSLVPTTCFNCESACGLLAYVDKATNQVAKFEGNPHHPGSRGRNCAKGPATINQVNDPERILYPLKREGARGEGKWTRITWDEALDGIAAKIRASLIAERRDKVVYHVGRPGHEGYTNRVLQAWGVDGHNSHTNICSGGARTGYALWHKYDRPSPDHTHARVILLASSHLETGHYFNPHAQRIMEGKMKGAKLIVLDPRLSNTASMADHWLPTYPGSETAVFLAIAKYILDHDRYDRAFVEHWVNWADYLKAEHPSAPVTFEAFIEKAREAYAPYTLAAAAAEAGIPEAQLREVAELVAGAGSRLSTHVWRGPAIGNLGGWQVSRALHFLNVLTGSVGTTGGTAPSGWHKFHPSFFKKPPAQDAWNELHFPPEYTLCHYEMSEILPHLVKDGRGTMDVYFTRVFNPVWTYPDGFSWMEMLLNEEAVGCHIALTPTWNETAAFADYVLPMGHASERHDLNSYETHAATWIAFRQPVLREKARRDGKAVRYTYEVNPGEVWEEDEFWIELSWRIDPDGSLGIREQFESPYRPGEKIHIDEYYRYIFEHVPTLPEKAAEEGLTPLDYMRKYGAFAVEPTVYEKHLTPLTDADLDGSTDEEDGRIVKGGKVIGIRVQGRAYKGFPTPSGRQEFYSATMAAFGHADKVIPNDVVKSHIHPMHMDPDHYVLLPNFRLPVHIHSRSANAKWLAEIAHRNPIWINTVDAAKFGLKTGDLIKVESEIGWMVDKVWVSEAVKPGVVACSHHLGRWRREQDAGNRLLTNTVKITQTAPGKWKMETLRGVEPFHTDDPDTERVFWRDGGVHQNLIHAVQPDPISGHHCWLQRVKLAVPGPDEKYGDIFVDTDKSFAYYKKWNQWARDAEQHPDGLRRPLWFNRPLTPQTHRFYMPDTT